jgi:hypothetical protein
LSYCYPPDGGPAVLHPRTPGDLDVCLIGEPPVRGERLMTASRMESGERLGDLDDVGPDDI